MLSLRHRHCEERTRDAAIQKTIMTAKPEKVSASDRSIEEVLASYDNIPVSAMRQEIRPMIRKHQNFVLTGDTGSGKTTCLPPLLLEFRNERRLKGGIAVTQPRRIGARSVTGRLSDMMQSPVGERVGFHVRFENKTSEKTDITYMTDGILLEKIQYDPLLTEYAIVMVDEAHEQTTNIIFCLGLLMEVNKRRNEVGMYPIHIVVTSATIDRHRFAEYIGNGDRDNSIKVPDKMFDVDDIYLAEDNPNYDFVRGAAKTVKYIFDKKLDGNILIFMPGKREIGDTITAIENQIGVGTADIYPLHAELPPEDQDKIFSVSKKRIITVATNIAETGITPPGKMNIIDTGLVKETHFDPKSGIERLICTEASRASLDQRLGRAGRNDDGRCFRLFTRASYLRRPEYQIPEIQRSNHIQLYLTMKYIGIRNVSDFHFLDQPPRPLITQAGEMSYLLGATDSRDEITEIGKLIRRMKIEPRLGRMVIESMRPELNCVNEISIIAAFLDGKTVFVRPTDFDLQREADRRHDQFKTDKDSDFVVILNVWKAYVASGYSAQWAQRNFLNEKSLEEAKNVRLDLLDVLESHGISIDPEIKPKINKDALGKAITAGLVGNLMRCSHGTGLKKVDGTKSDISIHPGSILSHRSFADGTLIVSDEIFISPQNKAYACNCLEVKREWLAEVAPEIARTITASDHHRKGKSHEHHGRHFSRNVYNHHSRNRF